LGGESPRGEKGGEHLVKTGKTWILGYALFVKMEKRKKQKRQRSTFGHWGGKNGREVKKGLQKNKRKRSGYYVGWGKSVKGAKHYSVGGV